eukprot:28774-Eustigmatos_ZCMA.PRE.1
MQKAWVSGLRGASTSSRAGNHAMKGVSHHQSAKAASKRSATCPRPKGTDTGYSSASGHNASSTRPP